ncbi:hypothetical protein V8C86DRAFT_2648191 [Haematococcus lacustris]
MDGLPLLALLLSIVAPHGVSYARGACSRKLAGSGPGGVLLHRRRLRPKGAATQRLQPRRGRLAWQLPRKTMALTRHCLTGLACGSDIHGGRRNRQIPLPNRAGTEGAWGMWRARGRVYPASQPRPATGTGTVQVSLSGPARPGRFAAPRCTRSMFVDGACWRPWTPQLARCYGCFTCSGLV